MATSENRPVPHDVIEAAIKVCGMAFYYKDSLKSLFLTSGVPAGLYEKHAEGDQKKFLIARGIFRELQQSVPADHKTILSIVTELANLRGPDATATDQLGAQQALETLKELVVSKRLLVDMDHAERERRGKSEQQRLSSIRQTENELTSVSKDFAALHAMTNVQKRGYALEKLLVRLFAAYGVTYRPPYRTEREQIDGAFEFKSFHYLLEARWRGVAPDFGDLADFKGKVDGKLESTRGVFLSMVGFDEPVVAHFMGVARGSRNNLLLIDGQDLALMIDGTVPLNEGLDYKISRASQEGVWWAPLSRR